MPTITFSLKLYTLKNASNEINAIISIIPEHSKSICNVIDVMPDDINIIPYLKYAVNVPVTLPITPARADTHLARGIVSTGCITIIIIIKSPRLPHIKCHACIFALPNTDNIYSHINIIAITTIGFIFKIPASYSSSPASLILHLLPIYIFQVLTMLLMTHRQL